MDGTALAAPIPSFSQEADKFGTFRASTFQLRLAHAAMSDPFFDHRSSIRSVRPARHWELDDDRKPTQRIEESRRRAQFITPIPKPKKGKGIAQAQISFDEGKGLSDDEQQYEKISIANELRHAV